MNKKNIDDLSYLIENNASEEEYKTFLGSLSKDEWSNIHKQLAPNPFKGKMHKLRLEAIKEKEEQKGN